MSEISKSWTWRLSLVAISAFALGFAFSVQGEELEVLKRVKDRRAFLAQEVEVNQGNKKARSTKSSSTRATAKNVKAQAVGEQQVAQWTGAPGESSANRLKTEEAKEATQVVSTPWSTSVGVEHYEGFYEDTDPTSALFVAMGYKLGNSGYSLGLAQSVSKFYYVIPGESDFKLNDTQISVAGPLSKDIGGGISLSGNLSATLPVSEMSQLQDHVSKITLALPFSRSFMDQQFTVSLMPMARYYWNKYTTTKTSPGSGGGTPLTQYLAGANLSLSYSLNDRWSLTTMSGYYRLGFEQIKKENQISTYGFTNPPTHSYVFGALINYQATDKWGLRMGYNHGDRLEKPWGAEVLLFDDRISQWYLGTTYTL